MRDNGQPASSRERQVTLLETLDRLLNRGVVVAGDVTLSVADVDLIYLGLRLLISSVETASLLGGGLRPPSDASPRERLRGQNPRSKGDLGSELSGPTERMMERRTLLAPESALAESEGEVKRLTEALPRKINADPEKVEQGLAKLVLTLIELLRKLLEKQALRRIEAGSLTPEEIERMGVTFLRMDEKMAELRAHFGLSEEDLNLSLGPLGDLM